MPDKSRWDKNYKSNGEYTLKDPYLQYIAGQRSIERIRAGQYNLHADTNVFRLHSVITNCKKELRNFITIDNKPVVAVDLSNSQPSLLLILLDLAFWDNTGAFNSSHIPYLNAQSIFKDKPHYNQLIMLLKKLQSNENGRVGLEIEQYKSLVMSGHFYDQFRALLNDRLGGQYGSSVDIKSMVFSVLFSDNRFIGAEDAAPKRVFRDIFPQIYDVICCIKRGNPAILPITLQRIESYIMYYRICPTIALKCPDLAIIPIHDSIATVNEYGGFVEQIMREEFGRCLGFTPHFKKEYWTPDNVNNELQAIRA